LVIAGERTPAFRSTARGGSRGGVGCALAVLALFPATAAAQVSVTLRPARDAVDVGEQLRVDVEINSTAGIPDTIGDLPATGFVQLGSQQSQSMQFSFGFGGGQQQRLTLVHTFFLQAQQAGAQTLGPVQVQLGNRTFASGTVQVQVRPGGGNVVIPAVPGVPTTPTTDAESTAVCRRPDGSPLPETGADGPATCIAVKPDLFLQLEVTDVRVYLGEPLRMQIRAFVERDLVGFSIGQLFSQLVHQEPTLEGFLRTNLEPREIEIESQFVQGRPYLWTTLRDKLLYPTRIGRLEIGPAEALISMHDFLRTREIRRTTPALPIEVLPLPAPGKPAGFSPNNVGARLVLSLTAQPTTIRAGEPVQVTLTLSGEGSLAGFRIEPPEIAGAAVLKSSDRVTEPTAAELNGSRSLTFLVTPSAPGELDLSSFAVPYFDYEQERYAVARPDAVRITVTPALPGRTPAGAGAEPTAAAAPGRPTASIRPWNDLGRPSAPVHEHWLFWVLLLFPPASLAGLHAVLAATRFVRRRRGIVRPGDVYRQSLSALRRVARGKGDGDAAAQLAAVESALLDYLAVRMGEPLGGYATSELQRRLIAAGFPDTVVARLVAQLDTCSFGRFAPSASRLQGASDAARGAIELLGSLERVKLPRAGEDRK
jgi:hypothetical protein